VNNDKQFYIGCRFLPSRRYRIILSPIPLSWLQIGSVPQIRMPQLGKITLRSIFSRLALSAHSMRPFQSEPVFLGSADFCSRNGLLRHIKQRFGFTAVQARIGLRIAITFRPSSSDCGNRRSSRARMAQNRNARMPFSPMSLPLAVFFSSAKTQKSLDKQRLRKLGLFQSF
jgi:hypothetical protein